MSNTETLYLTQEDLYRIGNASSSKLADVRQGEVRIVEVGGIKTVVANDQGVSLYNKTGLDDAPLSGWVYEIKTGTALPPGLRLWKDPKIAGHYHVCAAHNMPYHKYVGLLEELALRCTKVFKKKSA
ncbi:MULTISPECIES: hypothetical protein [unclassified Microbulbifer]|uniref:Tse2 family ADP-ribosyltransferase toxin n=1 Tax=unclassified Microbulbifer TaxID=2619833 RepID=UPI0027E45A8A|nr:MULTISPECIES: hypothetical protein [unclassified Microbulbifer]